MGVTESGIGGDREFPSTSWSLILRAREPASPDYARSLERLIELYWRPVYCVIRHAYTKDHDEAKDLTQDFFATVVLDRELVRRYAPERGSFRSFLRPALTRFMHDVARGAGRQKRGGGAPVVSLERLGGAAVEPVLGAETLTPEQVFDRAWNETVMGHALALLEKRLAAEGKQAAYEAFRRYDLEAPPEGLSYAALAEALSMSVPQVKHALIYARDALREIVMDLVRGYVDDPSDLAVEVRSLLGG
jgi:RNA polymerase sigma factor (sigma-70 family)